MLWTLLLTLQSPPAPPATDIYLADLRVVQGRVTIGAPVNVTNRAGYDNQPFFLPDGHAFLYTSVRDSQADIYRYDIGRKTSVQLTTTHESEYSPTPLPGGKGFSVVRVEADSTQRLWAFDDDGTHPRLVLDSIKPVGYHAWADEHTLVLFVLGTPPTLQIADSRAPKVGPGMAIRRDIGRSLQRIPGRTAVSFVQRDSVAGNWLEELVLHPVQIRKLVKTPPGADFFAWTREGIVLTASGTTLYQWNSKRGGEWETVADFAAAGLTNMTRLALSPNGDYLAIVAVPKP